MKNDTTTFNKNQDIRVKTSFKKSYPVTADLLEKFRGHSDALHFFLYAATMPSEFILRREHMKKSILGIGDHRFRREIKFLKELGVLSQKAVRGDGGFVGSEYLITDIRADQSKPAPFGDCSDLSISDMSETYAHIIQGGDKEDLAVRGVEDFANVQMIPFSGDADANRQAFLDMFPGVKTFQTFDDKPTKRRELNHIFHEYDPLNFEAMNDKDAGVFLTVNETDGKGRTAENVTSVRAVYADLDGAPLAPVLDYKPHMVVESSPGRYHAYWLTNDVPLDQFRDLQKSIIALFDADKSVHDLPHVMRMPGFYWRKQDQGYLTKIIFTSDRADKFTCDELKAMFPPLKKSMSTAMASSGPLKIHGASKGERNSTLCRLLGGIAKRGGDMDQMNAAAYEFGRKCDPPLSKRAIETTLSGARKWVS